MATLGNRFYTCRIDFAAGRIVSLKKGERELLSGDALPLFELALLDRCGGRTVRSAFDAESCTIRETDGGMEAVYTGWDIPGLSVRVSVTCEEDAPGLEWRIAVHNPSDRLIEWIDYPQLSIPDALARNGGDGQILWPYNEGVLVDDMDLREASMCHYREPLYPSLGLYGIYPSMVESQFLAYLFAGQGLYIGAHDPRFGVKGIDFCRCQGGIKLQFRHYACSPGGMDYTMEYPVVFRFFDGDWHDAAELYRQWFESSKPEEFVEISQNPNLPSWYAQSPVVVTYPVRGLHDMDDMQPNALYPYMEAMPVIEQLARDMGSKVLVLLMHWEGTAPWAPPYVWPPFGGEEVFGEFVDALHKQGHLIGVYCSGIGWTQQSNLIASYNKEEEFQQRHLEKAMCRAPDGQLPLSRICTGQRSGYDMCPASDITREIFSGEIQKLAAAHIDYAQVLDQNHGGNSYFCYSREHGHPPAPGRWQVQAMKQLLGMLKPEDSRMLFGCESAASEPFIPQLLFSDNRFELNYHMGTPVPAYAYLYHAYVNNFMGNQVGLNFTATEDDLLYRLGYSFAAGDMSTLVLTQTGDIMQYWGSRNFDLLPDKAAVLSFIKNINAWRTGAGRDYLHLGRMLKPCALQCEGKNRILFENREPLLVDKLLTSCWQAPDGSVGQIVVNYNREEWTFSMDLPADRRACLIEAPHEPCPPREITGDTQIPISPLSALLVKIF